MKINKELILCIIKTIVIGSIFSVFVNTDVYKTLEKPPLSPPSIVFPIVWTILFILMGISLYLIKKSKSYDKDSSILIYYIQLIINSLWTLIYFGLNWRILGFIWIIGLLIIVIIMTIKFYKIDKRAAYLNIPYILWLSFAGYLSLAIYLLNN